MENKEENVLTEVTELFMKYGIKSLTMDDIARSLGISKKTLYLFVSDKKDLVRKGIKLMIENEQKYVTEVIESSSTAIDELIGITKCVSTKLSDIHPSVVFDLQKYHPLAWKIIENHKSEFVYNVMLNNLKRGIEQGLYRKSINPEVIANIYILLVDSTLNINSPISKSMNIEKLHLEVINYHLKGISNEKGIAYLKTILEKDENNNLSIN